MKSARKALLSLTPDNKATLGKHLMLLLCCVEEMKNMQGI